MSGRLRELAALFLKLGTISFGGPAAHIALMEEEVVHRRRWLTREHFLDLVGATNLIPGPNSTEMAIHVGFLRGGWPGLIVAGACFILPAALITAGFAWVYVRFGSLPNAAPFLMGIKPVVVAVILTAIWRLGKTAVKTWQLLVIGVIVAATALLGVNEILAFFLGGVGGMCWLSFSNQTRRRHRGNAGVVIASVLGVHGRSWAAIAVAGAAIATQVSLWKLGLFFLKVGSVLYGSGYVLVAFLQGGLVRDYGWLTQQQLLDAIAIGQMTPGPVLSTATCIGYLLAGSAGAVAATVAIFLPSFVFVAMLNPIIPKLRRLRWTSAFLDAVNVSAIALMAAVLIQFARAALADWRAWLIALVAVAVGLRWKLNTAWLILGGGLAGWVLSVLVEH